MKKKVILIIISIIITILLIFTFALPFILPCVIFEKNYEFICLKIRKEEVIDDRKKFIQIGKRMINNLFFKRLTILLLIFIFSSILSILLGFKQSLIFAFKFVYIAIKYAYNFIFNNFEFYNPYKHMILNLEQIFFIIYLLGFIYIYICLNLINLSGKLYLKKYWNKNLSDIILFDEKKKLNLISNTGYVNNVNNNQS